MAKNRPNKKKLKNKNEKNKKVKKNKDDLKWNLEDGVKSKDSKVNKGFKIYKKPEKLNKKEFKELNIKNFKTLEQYKLYISHICTQAITYPETELKHIKLLFNIIEKDGGGSEILLNHVKKLSILSIVSVVCHMLPRVSYELNEVDQEVVKRTETTHSAKIISQEREITNTTIEIRDQLIEYIKCNISENPELFVQLISRLINSDNRVCDELFTLCLKYSKVSQSCLNSINEMFLYGSLLDIHRYLRFIFKSPYVNYKVIQIINNIQINKKQHEFLLSESSMKTEDNKKTKSKSDKENKYKNEILSWIITFYTKTLREGNNINMMESCIDGLGKFGMILEESIQLEILLELKNLLNEFIEKDYKNYKLVVSGINSSIKLVKVVKNFEYNWIYELFTKVCQNITPVLFQGELSLEYNECKVDLSEMVRNKDNQYIQNSKNSHHNQNCYNSQYSQNSVFFTHPCYTHKFLRCLDNLANLLVKSTIIADFQILSEMVQVLISLSLMVDSGVALSLMYYVNEIVSKVPKLKGLLTKEGIVFSILTKGKSSYWDMILLSSHYSHYIRVCFGGIKDKDSNSTNLKNKLPSFNMDSKVFEQGKYFNYSGLDVYQMLISQNIM